MSLRGDDYDDRQAALDAIISRPGGMRTYTEICNMAVSDTKLCSEPRALPFVALAPEPAPEPEPRPSPSPIAAVSDLFEGLRMHAPDPTDAGEKRGVDGQIVKDADGNPVDPPPDAPEPAEPNKKPKPAAAASAPGASFDDQVIVAGNTLQRIMDERKDRDKLGEKKTVAQEIAELKSDLTRLNGVLGSFQKLKAYKVSDAEGVALTQMISATEDQIAAVEQNIKKKKEEQAVKKGEAEAKKRAAEEEKAAAAAQGMTVQAYRKSLLPPPAPKASAKKPKASAKKPTVVADDESEDEDVPLSDRQKPKAPATAPAKAPKLSKEQKAQQKAAELAAGKETEAKAKAEAETLRIQNRIAELGGGEEAEKQANKEAEERAAARAATDLKNKRARENKLRKTPEGQQKLAEMYGKKDFKEFLAWEEEQKEAQKAALAEARAQAKKDAKAEAAKAQELKMAEEAGFPNDLAGYRAHLLKKEADEEAAHEEAMEKKKRDKERADALKKEEGEFIDAYRKISTLVGKQRSDQKRSTSAAYAKMIDDLEKAAKRQRLRLDAVEEEKRAAFKVKNYGWGEVNNLLEVGYVDILAMLKKWMAEAVEEEEEQRQLEEKKKQKRLKELLAKKQEEQRAKMAGAMRSLYEIRWNLASDLLREAKEHLATLGETGELVTEKTAKDAAACLKYDWVAGLTACLEEMQNVKCFQNQLPGDDADRLTNMTYDQMVAEFEAGVAAKGKAEEEAEAAAKAAEDKERKQLQKEVDASVNAKLPKMFTDDKSQRGVEDEEDEKEEEEEEEEEEDEDEEYEEKEETDSDASEENESDDSDDEERAGTVKEGEEGEEEGEEDENEDEDEDEDEEDGDDELNDNDLAVQEEEQRQRDAFNEKARKEEAETAEEMELEEARAAAAAAVAEEESSDDDSDDEPISRRVPMDTTAASRDAEGGVADHVVAGTLQEPVVQRTAAPGDEGVAMMEVDDAESGEEGEEGSGDEEDIEETAAEKAARKAEEAVDELAEDDEEMNAADEEGGESDSGDEVEIERGLASLTMTLGSAVVLTLKGSPGNETQALADAEANIRLALEPLSAMFRNIAYVLPPKPALTYKHIPELSMVEPFYLLLKDGDKSYDAQIQEKAAEKFEVLKGLSSEKEYRWIKVPFYEKAPTAATGGIKQLQTFSSFGIWPDAKQWSFATQNNGETVTVRVFVEPDSVDMWPPLKDYKKTPIPVELRYDPKKCCVRPNIGAVVGEGVMTRLRRAHTAPFGARTAVPTAVKPSKALAKASSSTSGPTSAIGKKKPAKGDDPKWLRMAKAAAGKQQLLQNSGGGKAWAETVMRIDKLTTFLKRRNANGKLMEVVLKALTPIEKERLGLVSVEVEPPIVLTAEQEATLKSERGFRDAYLNWSDMPYNEKLEVIDGLNRTAMGGAVERDLGAAATTEEEKEVRARAITARAKKEQEEAKQEGSKFQYLTEDGQLETEEAARERAAAEIEKKRVEEGEAKAKKKAQKKPPKPKLTKEEKEAKQMEEIRAMMAQRDAGR